MKKQIKVVYNDTYKAIRDSKFAKLFKAKTQSTPVMSHEEAMRYYKSAIGGLDVSVGELLNDPRLCHILIHGSGIFPKYVQDEDAFFDAALQILSEKEKNEKADDNYEAYRRANYRPSEDSDMND